MAEERLWAPWRLEYIKGPKGGECIFCVGPDSGDDRAKYVVRRGEHCFAILNKYPYNNGHLMVAPFRHVPSIEELNEAELLELMTLTQESLAALREAYQPEGFNLGVNQGKIAGAGVEDHVHMHVVPRWGADTNYMPVIGDTRVLPQSLDDSFDDITRAFSVAAR
ncbi:MAG: HIT domain-containing protein [Actinobacteria bacterium]|nr:MAG: HIT domain-containing protein [Actinomycetota bacterium]TMM10073.1 MAG: HIT domain-containing protein [Actinomycetota bacterium]